MYKIFIVIILVFFYSCGPEWEWEADPYVGDSETQSIINADEIEIKCNHTDFNDFTCFSSDNIAELKLNIEKFSKLPKKTRNILIREINSVFKFGK